MLFFALVLAVACSEPPASSSTAEDVADGSDDDTGPIELDTEDKPEVDELPDGTPGPGADFGDPPDADVDAPICGEFGEPCTANEECCSEYCVEAHEGFQCTQTCIDECPDGFECKTVLTSYPDVTTICVPITSKLCSPCEIDLQCNGGECVDVGGKDFCTVDCSKDACPEGYHCTVGEDGASRCFPTNGTCDCSADSAGQVRPCGVQNEFGACTGTELCLGDEGWSECDAPTPAEEICNGLDDDCDGLPDEGFDEPEPCEATSEFGTCSGIATCQGSAGIVCSAKAPIAEVCDFLDNDCDETADEDFKNAQGKYGTLNHCGGCGKDCEGLFPNGTAACDATKPVYGGLPVRRGPVRVDRRGDALRGAVRAGDPVWDRVSVPGGERRRRRAEGDGVRARERRV